MVATTDRYASDVGVEVLREGGNAVDAAVAVGFALAVVNPEAGNVGGSGYMLVRTPQGDVGALDFRGTAPAAAIPDTFLRAPDGASELGHLAVAVPGSVRGLAEAHARFGRLPWTRLLEPAIELARGFAVGDRLLRAYPPHIVEGLRCFSQSVAIFLPDGEVPRHGDVLRQPELAATLERIRDHGADGFYRGKTADMLVEEMRRGGGLITHGDLEGYRAAWRTPVRFLYRDREVVSMPLSSSGGITLAMMAHILSCWDVGATEWHGALHVHLLAEAWRRAYTDRNSALADPDHVAAPADTLVSADYGAWRADNIRLDAASRSEDVAPGADAYRKQRQTTHVSIVDEHGGAVSFTTTLNTWYGSKLVAEGTGVLLNNEMDDFTTRPGEPNHFGLVQGVANAIAPGKRMLSAMTPTMVLDPGPGGHLHLVLGTPGGSTITTTVFQVISNVIDHGMSLMDAVAAPRVHHQHLPDRIQLEPGALPDDVVAELRAMGHDVEEPTEMWGDVQAVRVRPDDTLEGVADPRRGGVAEGL
jgi:gamma-glutamyltranspeptidase/glutathione hydrolase